MIIIIVACSVGACIIILIIIIVVRICISCKASTKESAGEESSENPETEVVYNSMYKSVEFANENAYEYAPSDSDVDALYAKVNKEPKTSPNATAISAKEFNKEDPTYTIMKDLPPPTNSEELTYEQMK